jgi:hypothetical protein
MKELRIFKEKFSLYNCIGVNSANTHNLKPMAKMYDYCLDKLIFENKIKRPIVIDPFARMCLWGTKRNDINPQFLHEYTTHCMDALEFLNNEPRGKAHIVIMDPPFSNRQSEEEYGTNNLYTNPKYISDLGKECFRILCSGGYLIKCGFNTNPPSKGFTLIHVKICNMGGSRNDILISLWKKSQTTLSNVLGCN